MGFNSGFKGLTQFLSVFMVRGVGVFDCSDGCPDNVGMVSVGIC